MIPAARPPERHKSPWVLFWIGLLASVSVLIWLGVAASDHGPVMRWLGAWVLVLPLLGAVFTLWAWVHGLVVTARRSKLWAVIDGFGTVVVAFVMFGFAMSFIPIMNPMQPRARIAKAQADVRSMASAASLYAAHMGTLPGAMSLVTASSMNARGQTIGALLAAIPKPPEGWSAAYYYASSADGTFTISATGDGTTARVP